MACCHPSEENRRGRGNSASNFPKLPRCSSIHILSSLSVLPWRMEFPVLAVAVILLTCIVLVMYNPDLFFALATQDILKTEVDVVTITQATLQLGFLPWYSLIFGYRSSPHAPSKTQRSVHPSTIFFPIFAWLCEHLVSQVFLQSRGNLCAECVLIVRIPPGLCLQVTGDSESYKLVANAGSWPIAHRTKKHNPCPQGIYSVFGKKGYQGRQACKGGYRPGL